ncbi:L,D-transpeptidase family protein [Flavisolibacter nicotianae]|uniref:L,D-transpeptidase family protein n=1 Tax=Flavisolibacter nicotianae TaxID=2364882 RepID=UPI000EB5A1CA|nr:L,D-transpeptidase family protein [Flavisolibacter nicotianae]
MDRKLFRSSCQCRIGGLLFSLLLFLSCFGQQVSTQELEKYRSWPRYALLVRFYTASNRQLAWLGKPALQNSLRQILQTASALGLDETDYQPAFFQTGTDHRPLKTRTDSVETDLRFTDAALHFFSDVKNGNRPPAFRYDGLRYAPGTEKLAEELGLAVANASLSNFMASIQPVQPAYTNALMQLATFQQAAAADGFNDAKVISTKVDSTNRSLLRRLVQLGITENGMSSATKMEVSQNLKLAQRQFDLQEDGKIGSATLAALNVPLRQRIQALRIFINTLRWLDQLEKSGPVLVLNLAATRFFLYENGKILFESKVIAGKKSTPSPTLTSTITEVILYPYWMVPSKIATKEMLPRIRRNIGYLEEGNYQVLNRSGHAVNPYSINWWALSRGYFPYVIRQSTGCDNALGIVKFNFSNPFTVYLHDTPTKTLFSSDRRYYSHGCMRIEKPIELARYLLGFNRIAIDTLTAKGCLEHQSPLPVPVQKRLPLVVLYSTVWYTANGDLRFYEDVYGKLNDRLTAEALVGNNQFAVGW